MRFVLLPLLLTATIAHAQDAAASANNRYDVFSRAVLPLVQTFTPDNPQHALRLEGRLSSITGQESQADPKVAPIINPPPATPPAVPTRVALATESPDKLRLEVTWNGQTYTIVRAGQRVWAAPGQAVQALIDAIPKLPKPEADYELPPLQIPFDLKQMALLPILFQIADAGEVDAAGQKVRVLDVTLMPELARGIGASDVNTRWWIRADGTPAQLKFTRANWQMTVALDKVQTGGSFPPETWQPTKAESADVLELSPVKVKQLLDAAGKQIKPKKKKPQP